LPLHRLGDQDGAGRAASMGDNSNRVGSW